MSEIMPFRERRYNSLSIGKMIIISIGDMQFRVILEHGNLWWGIVPKTQTKKKIDQYRKNSRSGIMKILEPMLKQAMVKLVQQSEKKGAISLEGGTIKARKMYQSWANYMKNKTGRYVQKTEHGLWI